MRIAITGASGFVGTAAVEHLTTAGHDVVRLVRRTGDGTSASDSPASRTAAWNPTTGELDTENLGAIDAVVHLAGENVAGGRWTKARRRAIRDSRGPVTERLAQSLAALERPPRVLVSASATGFYGDRGDTVLDEQSPAGQGFLADVATEWERGTDPARDAGIRVVNLRIGLVLHHSGGALARMLLPFRLGLGGRLGSGQQWLGFVTRHDLVRAVQFAIEHDTVRGPTLATPPQPVRNHEFTKALGQALRRPTVLPAPAFALRLLLGEMADALLLASQRVVPRVLPAAGFRHEHAEIGAAVRWALGKE